MLSRDQMREVLCELEKDPRAPITKLSRVTGILAWQIHKFINANKKYLRLSIDYEGILGPEIKPKKWPADFGFARVTMEGDETHAPCGMPVHFKVWTKDGIDKKKWYEFTGVKDGARTYRWHACPAKKRKVLYNRRSER